jgi:hypothetical protein
MAHDLSILQEMSALHPPLAGRRFSQPPVNKHVQVLRRLQRARERRFFVALC